MKVVAKSAQVMKLVQTRREAFFERMTMGNTLIQEADFGGFWKWVRSLFGERQCLSRSMVQPVLGPMGVLEVELEPIMEVWHDHLDSLYAYIPLSDMEALRRRCEASVPQCPPPKNQWSHCPR